MKRRYKEMSFFSLFLSFFFLFRFIRIRCLPYYVRGPMRQYVPNCFISEGTVKESFASGQAENWIQLFRKTNNRVFKRMISTVFHISSSLKPHYKQFSYLYQFYKYKVNKYCGEILQFLNFILYFFLRNRCQYEYIFLSLQLSLM